MKNYEKFSLFFIGIVFALFLFKCSETPSAKMNDRKYPNYIDTTAGKDSCFICCKDTMMKMLIKHDVKYPLIVCRQAILESGHFKSNIFKTRGNAFGFNNGHEYLKFKTVEDGVVYYKQWQNNKYIAGNYYDFLDSIHYSLSDSCYSETLRKIRI